VAFRGLAVWGSQIASDWGARRSWVHVIPYFGCIGPSRNRGRHKYASAQRLAFLSEWRYTPTEYGVKGMSPPDDEKIKLLKRLSRIRGQVEGIQRAVEGDASSATVLQRATACRGALDGFIAEVIEDHIRERMVQEKDWVRASKAAEELIGIVHSYLT
jgi:FrmR/RcnR family transcriptional regulator, repressor of frmRAB operon